MHSEFLKLGTTFLAASLMLSSCQLPDEGADTVRRAEDPGTGIAPLTTTTRGPALNDIARMLAGMGAGGSLASLQSASSWAHHQAQMNALWRRYDTGRGMKIRAWADQEISDLRRHRALFYPFSGPDLIYAQDLFPSAETYILAGLEPAELLPDLRTLTAGEASVGLDGLRTALSGIINAGYFVTVDMRSDLQSTRLRGTLPILLTFLARSGATVESADPIQLDGTGTPVMTNRSSSGLLIRFRSSSGRSKRLFYFSQDLSNGSTKLGGPFLTFVAKQGYPPALVKSASYLMHQDSFSNIRNYLTHSTPGFIQDPSGVPYRDIVAAGMKLDLYGNYKGTLSIFSQQQPDLMAAYRSGQHQVKPVDFGFGYLFNRSATSIMVARRR